MRWRSQLLAVALILGLLPVFVPAARVGAVIAPATNQSSVKPTPGLPQHSPVTCQPDAPCATAALVSMPLLQWVSGPVDGITDGHAWVVPLPDLPSVPAQAAVSPDLVPPRPYRS